MSTTLFIYVTDKGSNYATNQVRGNTGNSTSDPATAALRLAQKLYGPALQGVNRVPDENRYTTKWEITADPEHFASCDSRGVIHFGAFIPASNTALARGPMRALPLVVGEQALGGEWLLHDLVGAAVPRFPAAAPPEEKDAALLAWLQRCAKAVPKKQCLGVTFETTIRRATL